MISNMLRFPASMFDDDLDSWFFPQTRTARRQRPASFPPVNVGSTDSKVEVYLFAPGMDVQDLDVVIEKNLLSIAGDRKPAYETDEQTHSRQERFSGPFKRVITLPEEIDAESAEAVYRDGVLHISMAKQLQSKPRQIPISVQ